MATKSPNPAPNEPTRPAASRAKPRMKAAADSADAETQSRPVPKPKPMPKAKAKSRAVAQPKAAATGSAKKAEARPKSARADSTTKPEPMPKTKPAPKKAVAAPSATRRKSRAETMVQRGGTAPGEASAHENHVVKTLFDALEAHVEANELGHVVGPKEFSMGESEPTGRRPDIAFVSFDRWARYRRVPAHDRWHVAPDLLVQVVRAGELPEDFTTQLDERFNAGVRRVWLVFPDTGEVRVYEAASDVQTLGLDQSIEGGDVLPGFAHSLALLLGKPRGPG